MVSAAVALTLFFAPHPPPRLEVRAAPPPVAGTLTGRAADLPIRVTAVRSAYAEPAPAPVGDVWYRLAVCESGYGGPPRWSLNTGNGFYGGLQWVHSTWLWMGGDDFAYWPHHATAAQQIEVAERLVAYERAQGRGGFNPWPACADKLGLPR